MAQIEPYLYNFYNMKFHVIFLSHAFVQNLSSWLADGNHMYGVIGKHVLSEITCMVLLVSLYHQKSHVLDPNCLIGWEESREWYH